MFDDLDRWKQEMVFMGLKTLIETESFWDRVFHNSDPGHSVYRLGAKGTLPGKEDPDSPEKNAVFQMLSDLSKKIKGYGDDTGYVWWRDLSTWQDFCRFATECNDRIRLKKE